MIRQLDLLKSQSRTLWRQVAEAWWRTQLGRGDWNMVFLLNMCDRTISWRIRLIFFYHRSTIFVCQLRWSSASPAIWELDIGAESHRSRRCCMKLETCGVHAWKKQFERSSANSRPGQPPICTKLKTPFNHCPKFSQVPKKELASINNPKWNCTGLWRT